ncbi:MAG: peptidoglycan DD-metalloendopeptidase family protein [Bacteroidaceae bacterium]|nr:peptidoglycan DD-metalloendopeptidase family protein [Bacteroidaceae bacterium]
MTFKKSKVSSLTPLTPYIKTALLTIFLLLPIAVFPQNSKKVKALQKQKVELQNTLKKSKAELTKTKQQVKVGQQNIHYIGIQLNNRLDQIVGLEKEIDELDSLAIQLQGKIREKEGELKEKREKLKQAMRYARTQKNQNSSLIFILSAQNVKQMFRRSRFAKEYVSFEHNLGEQILRKQAELLEEQNKLLNTKSKKSSLVHEVMLQRKDLGFQQVQQKKKVEGLKKQESGLAGKIAEQQKQLNALNKKIDDLIAYEIEQARKAAEAAARKKAAEEAARKKAAEEAARKKAGKTGGKTTPAPKSTSKPTPLKPDTWLTAEDRQLNGTFEQNRGRLPVPITGQYMIGNRFGTYNVPGLKNVQLENKGTNYVGRPGARARSIFTGEVSAVFQFGGSRNVLIRHGSYISVYCNLSSVTVSKGQKVNTKDIIGTVADDGTGKCVLHFQLRKETTKLNPESWIGR